MKEKLSKRSVLRGGLDKEPLAVHKRLDGTPIMLVLHESSPGTKTLHLLEGDENDYFSTSRKKVSLILETGREENRNFIREGRLSFGLDGLVFSYVRETRGKRELAIATSKDGFSWRVLGKNSEIEKMIVPVPNFKHKNFYFGLYSTEDGLKSAFSSDFSFWQQPEGLILKERSLLLENNLEPVLWEMVSPYLLLFYQSSAETKDGLVLSLNYALLDSDDPGKIIYQNDAPLFRENYSFDSTVERLPKILGASAYGALLTIYVSDKNNLVSSITIPHPYPQKTFRHLPAPHELESANRPKIIRLPDNPIINPKVEHYWESRATFNTTACLLDGSVHLFYRAIGEDGISVIGYARSEDGINIIERLPYPIYSPKDKASGVGFKKEEWTTSYRSGPGSEGSEDPQVTVLEDRLYMTYAAFNGYEQARGAITSISLADFRKRNWHGWARPKFMTAPPNIWGTGNKNSCIMSQKIGGKYGVIHRVWPATLIDYRDDLEFKDENWLRNDRGLIKPPNSIWDKTHQELPSSPVPFFSDDGWCLFYSSPYGKTWRTGVMMLAPKDPSKIVFDSPDIETTEAKDFLAEHGVIPPRRFAWDSAKVGAGGPPIETKDGLLFIYKGTGYQGGGYHIGAMLLDKENPAKILFRSKNPILSPIMPYERKSAMVGYPVAFASGYVVKDEILYVYYGAADMYTCVATAPLDDFLKALKEEKDLKITAQPVVVKNK